MGWFEELVQDNIDQYEQLQQAYTSVTKQNEAYKSLCKDLLEENEELQQKRLELVADNIKLRQEMENAYIKKFLTK